LHSSQARVIAIRTSPRAMIRNPCVVLAASLDEEKPRPSARYSPV
jgi:hypothetical protein